jgi:hypothetical protein
MDDTQLKEMLAAGQELTNALSLGERYMEAAVVAGLVQTCRALRTKLAPPAKTEPHLAVVPAPGAPAEPEASAEPRTA